MQQGTPVTLRYCTRPTVCSRASVLVNSTLCNYNLYCKTRSQDPDEVGKEESNKSLELEEGREGEPAESRNRAAAGARRGNIRERGKRTGSHRSCWS